MDAVASPIPVRRLPRAQIEARLKICNPLPSLTSTNSTLSQLLSGEHRYTNQICDIIRQDPSLCARILQLVNSAYFGLAIPIRHIEQAVFYLGLEQIRQLTLITPVIEDLKHLVKGVPFSWREFWQHSIGTAIMTREVMRAAGEVAEEAEYLSGLLHDVGKIVMASVFPHHFLDIQQCVNGVVQDLQEVESFVLGINHSELGGLYLQSHNVPDLFVQTARHHHASEENEGMKVVAAVQVADLLMREAKIGNSGNPRPVSREQCCASWGWMTLFGSKSSDQMAVIVPDLDQHIADLPVLLEAMV